MAEKTISLSYLRAHCSRVMADVERGQGPITVTRRGRPVARIVALKAARQPLFGILKGTVTIHGDIVGPTDVKWEADE